MSRKPTPPPEQSPALQFVSVLWDNAMEKTGHSWTRLNSTLYQSVFIAIESGLRFDVNDINVMYKTMRGGYWFHDDNGERWYAAACKWDHVSACHALESYLGREPYIDNGKRLCVGSRIAWGEHRYLDVKSMNALYLTACKMKTKENGYGSKVAARVKITLAELKAREAGDRKAKNDAKKAAKTDAKTLGWIKSVNRNLICNGTSLGKMVRRYGSLQNLFNGDCHNRLKEILNNIFAAHGATEMVAKLATVTAWGDEAVRKVFSWADVEPFLKKPVQTRVSVSA